MGIHERMNKNKTMAMSVACLLIVTAVVLIALQARGGGDGTPDPTGGKAFFSTDDGKTWFAADAMTVPPFNKDGKEAVRAYVYRAGDGTEFVGYLERYTPVGKKSLKAALAQPEQLTEDPFSTVAGELQVKKPGDAAWISASDPRAAKVQTVVSPKGKSDVVSPVSPR